MLYHKILISPGLIFFQKAFLLGLFSGELLFAGAYYWKAFCISKWVGIDNKTASTNSPWAYIRGRVIIGGIFASQIWGAYFKVGGGGGYYRNFMVF